MAKTIKSKVDYQMNELVSNLNEAATAQSEQKRDYFTTKAMYNARRLQAIVTKAKIGAMALVIAFGLTACGANETTPGQTPVVTTPAETTATTTPVSDTTATVTTTDSSN
jgi:hypothetical protein